MMRCARTWLLMCTPLVAGCFTLLDQRELAGGPSDAGPPGSPCPGNLVQNPGFEDGTSGWEADAATLSRRSGGHDGAWAAHVCRDATSSESYYDISTVSPTVVHPPNGAIYQLTAWVRSD